MVSFDNFSWSTKEQNTHFDLFVSQLITCLQKYQASFTVPKLILAIYGPFLLTINVHANT